MFKICASRLAAKRLSSLSCPETVQEVHKWDWPFNRVRRSFQNRFYLSPSEGVVGDWAFKQFCRWCSDNNKKSAKRGIFVKKLPRQTTYWSTTTTHFYDIYLPIDDTTRWWCSIGQRWAYFTALSKRQRRIDRTPKVAGSSTRRNWKLKKHLLEKDLFCLWEKDFVVKLKTV